MFVLPCLGLYTLKRTWVVLGRHALSKRPDEAVHVASLADTQRPRAIRVGLRVRHLGEEHAPLKHDSHLVPLGGALRRRVVECKGRRSAPDALGAACREHVLQQSFRQ